MLTSWDLLTGDDDALLARAEVAIYDSSSKKILGTGTFVSTDGAILTAHHVVSNDTAVVVRKQNGEMIEIEVQPHDLYPDADLAILSSNLSACDALPIAALSDYVPSHFLTRGFQFRDRGFSDAVPLTGRIGGRTQVEYGRYRPNSVLSLPNSNIDKGASGSPLYDPDTRTIVGIIVGGIENGPDFAFAIPFDASIAASWPRLHAVLSDSAKILPRFGKLMNHAGALSICDAQRKKVADFLANAQLFKRGKIVNREFVSSAISDFWKSEKRVLPLVGLSGVGKTSVLGQLADNEDPALPPRILVRGVDIIPSQDGIVGLLGRALSKLSEELGMKANATPADFIRVFNHHRDALLVLLDGLNEASCPLPDLVNSWIPKSVDWLKGRNVKLVVSSRPEVWELLANTWPTHLIFGECSSPSAADGTLFNTESGDANNSHKKGVATETRRLVVPLGDFTLKEVTLALDAYGLKDRLSPADALHPFMLAIADEIGFAAGPLPSNIDAVLTLFIKRKIDRALLRKSPIWVQHVHQSVERAAALMLRRQVQSLSAREMTGIFGPYHEAIDALTEEHLWIIESDEYRFQFDQVREFLQARSVDALSLLGSIVSLDRSQKITGDQQSGSRKIISLLLAIANILTRKALQYFRIGYDIPPSVASFSILSLLTSVERGRFLQALDLLKEGTVAYPETDRSRFAQKIAVSIISRLRDAGTYTDQYVEWVRAIVENEAKATYTHDEGALLEVLTDALVGLRIPMTKKLDLVRPMFITEWAAYWRIDALRNEAWAIRYHDREYSRDRKRTLSSERNRTLARCLEGLAQINAQAALDTLLQWLDDETPIGIRVRNSNSDVTIGDCAAICLFYLRYHDLYRICTHVLSKATPRTEKLLDALAIVETEKVALVSIMRLTEKNMQPIGHAARCLWQCAKNAGHPEVKIIGASVASELLRSEIEPKYRVWFARAMFADYLPSSEALESAEASEESWAARIKKTLEPNMPEAADFLIGVMSCCEERLIEEDCDYLCRYDFGRAAEAIESRLDGDMSLSVPLSRGLMRVLSGRLLNKFPERFDHYKCIVRLVSKLYDRGQSDIRLAIADELSHDLGQAGVQVLDAYLSVDDAINLGLLELGKRIIREAEPQIRKKFVHMAIGSHGQIRAEILTVMRDELIDDDTFGEFVYKLSCNVVIYGGSFGELLSFRCIGRHELWDRAVLRYISILDSDLSHVQFSEDCVAVWRSLSPADQTDIVREFFLHWDHVGSPREAATRTVWYKR